MAPAALTAPASAACTVGVIPSSATVHSSAATLAATDYRTAAILTVSSTSAKARGRAHQKFDASASVTTTLRLDPCLTGRAEPVYVAASRSLRQGIWGSGAEDRYGYGADRRTEALDKSRTAASDEARKVAASRAVAHARAAAYDAALGSAVQQGLLASAAGYRSAVVSSWSALANQARTARGLGAVRFVHAFDPLATDWASTVHSSYDSRVANGTIHDPGFWRDLQVSGCTSSFRSGEIIAQLWRSGDPRRVARDAYDAWMGSSTHRAILLDGRYTMSGIGIYASGDWVTLVGRFRNGSCSVS